MDSTDMKAEPGRTRQSDRTTVRKRRPGLLVEFQSPVCRWTPSRSSPPIEQ